jgi:integrase
VTLAQVKGGFSEMIRAGKTGKGRADQFRLKIVIADEFGSPIERLRLAERRVAVLRRMRDDLVRVGRGADAKVLMIEAGKVAVDDALFEAAVSMAEVVASLPKERSLRWRTWGELADAWTSGELARLYPRAGYGKETHTDDIPKVDLFRAVIGDVELCAFNDENYWSAMRLLSSDRSDSTFRHHAQVIRRVLKLAVELGLIEKWPLGPNCKLPKIDKSKTPIYTFVYPAEDALLMACADVPFEYRVLWGFIMREGLRISEAFRIRWEHIDRSFPRGILRVPETKTGRALEFVFEMGTLAALDELRRRMPNEAGPFSWLTESALDKVAERVRKHLVRAGCDRQTLLFTSGRQRRLREHDLRATFVTLAKLAGRDDSYVSCKTGHESSKMIQRYNHSKAMLEQLDLPPLAPLDLALGLGGRLAPPLVDPNSAAAARGRSGAPQAPAVRPDAGHPASAGGCDTGCDGDSGQRAAEPCDDPKSSMFNASARDRGRTCTPLRALEPKSSEPVREGSENAISVDLPLREASGTDGPSQQGVTLVEAYARALKAAMHLAIDANASLDDVGQLRRMYDVVMGASARAAATTNERAKSEAVAPAAAAVVSLNAARKRRDEGAGK